jgi:hypothetical protein
MQLELAATCDPDSCGPQHTMQAIHILGVNARGAEADNETISAGRTIPWLQDTAAQNVTDGTWHVTNRDVVILDSQNRQVAVFNCTTYDLAVAENYAALKALMLQAAHRPIP